MNRKNLLAALLAVAIVCVPSGTLAAPGAGIYTSTAAKPGITSDTTRAVQLTLKSHGYSIIVDGVYGKQTTAAVRHWQRSNGLLADGIAGPVTLGSLDLTATADAPVPAIRVDPPPGDAESALRGAGATESEIDFLMPICQRESGCRLEAYNYNPSTHDDSYGPWQINFYGSLAQGLERIGITRSNVNDTWHNAAVAVLSMLHNIGRCAWIPPGYCS